jgi:hypothetical protein
MAVAGANIANAAGRPEAGSPYNPWSARVIQDPIGAYVEAPTETRLAAATNYIGVNNNVAYKTNVLGQGSVAVGPTIAPQPDWQVPVNDNDALDTAAKGAQWVRAAGTIAAGGTCTIAAGAATAGAGTFECNVVGGVVAGDFFWANLTADT